MDHPVTITVDCDRCQRTHQALNPAWVRARRLQEERASAAFAARIGVDRYHLRDFECGRVGLPLEASRRALIELHEPGVELT